MHEIQKGLDVPIPGAPVQIISPGPVVTRVAFVADDFHGLKPRVRVSEGQAIRRGDLLCEDGALPGVRHTASGAGRVEAIHRGPRRALQSIVVALSEDERQGAPAEEELRRFPTPPGADPDGWERFEVRDLLIESGMWPAFRTRPFGRVPAPEAVPDGIFVNAMDTNPLAADPEVVLAEVRDPFARGLRAVARLSGGQTWVCVAPGSGIARNLDAPVVVEEFTGPHPAGTAGVHIHTLAPVGRNRTVWTIGYQDVVSIGRLIESGHLDVQRIIALGGPPVANPRLVRTRIGCSIADFQRSEGSEGEVRWISGSVLSGKAAAGEAFGYMGRYDLQLSVIAEGGERKFLAWLAPGSDRISILPVFVSKLLGRRPVDLSTDAHGSPRAILPIGVYERVVPMDILPTFLLRALAAGDLERAEALGCLELDEEDLALCSYVDPGKADFGPMLRRALTAIEGGK